MMWVRSIADRSEELSPVLARIPAAPYDPNRGPLELSRLSKPGPTGATRPRHAGRISVGANTRSNHCPRMRWHADSCVCPRSTIRSGSEVTLERPAQPSWPGPESPPARLWDGVRGTVDSLGIFTGRISDSSCRTRSVALTSGTGADGYSSP